MTTIPFIHLRTQSSYSLAESAIKIDKLVKLALKNNMPAIALTDNNNMFGTLEFSLECQKNGIQPIVGSSISIIDIPYKNKLPQLNFLVKNAKGYKNLLLLSSKSHIEQDKSVGVTIDDVIGHSDGLICYLGGEFNPLLFYKLQNKYESIELFLYKIISAFKNDLYFELQRIEDSLLDEFENEFIQLAEKNNIPLIGTNNVKFENIEDYNAHDALLCIAQKATINQENRIKSNPNIFFKNTNEMFKLFEDIPDVIQNNFNVALKCKF